LDFTEACEISERGAFDLQEEKGLRSLSYHNLGVDRSCSVSSYRRGEGEFASSGISRKRKKNRQLGEKRYLTGGRDNCSKDVKNDTAKRRKVRLLGGRLTTSSGFDAC